MEEEMHLSQLGTAGHVWSRGGQQWKRGCSFPGLAPQGLSCSGEASCERGCDSFSAMAPQELSGHAVSSCGSGRGGGEAQLKAFLVWFSRPFHSCGNWMLNRGHRVLGLISQDLTGLVEIMGGRRNSFWGLASQVFSGHAEASHGRG